MSSLLRNNLFEDAKCQEKASGQDNKWQIRKFREAGKGNLHLLTVRHKAEVRGSFTQQNSIFESDKQINTDIADD